MKIKISISDTYMVADMPEKKAREIFWKMSEMIKITITRETYEALYGALCKLRDYEGTGLSPAETEELRRQQDSHRWIPVKERLPEEEVTVWVTVKHSSWISDYGSDFVPKEEWRYHPESSIQRLGETHGSGNSECIFPVQA